MNVTKRRDKEEESLLTTPNHHSQQQENRQNQQGSSEHLRMKRNMHERRKTCATNNELPKIPTVREDEERLRPNPIDEEEKFSCRVTGMKEEIEMELLGYQTIVYVIFLMSAVILVAADYGISVDCMNLKRFDIVFFVTAGSGFFVMLWTVLIRSLKPECFISSCSCFPLLVVNLMLLAIFITLGAGELFNPECGAGWARGWLMMYWIWFVFIFPLVPLMSNFVRGCYLSWYHLLALQVVYIAHAMDIWFRGEDNAIPQYTRALTWFFLGSSAWVITMYLTTFRYLAFLWAFLGYCLVFWSADAVWRLGGPHGLEAQILLIVFNLLVSYVLWYRLYEMLSPLFRKDLVKLPSESFDEDEKRLSLRSSLKSLFKPSLPEHTRKIVKTTRGKGFGWNSGWTLVNNTYEANIVCVAPGHNDFNTLGKSVVSETMGDFNVETQFQRDYVGSTDDEVRIHIQESSDEDEEPQQIPSARVVSFHTQRLPVAEKWHKQETAVLLETIQPLLSSNASEVHIEKDCNNSREVKSLDSITIDQEAVAGSIQKMVEMSSSQPTEEDTLLLGNDYSQAELRQASSPIQSKRKPVKVPDGVTKQASNEIVVEKKSEKKEIVD